MKAKLLDVQNLLWLALLLALSGSLKHLANVFASVDGNAFMGWLQAVAIDAGLFALAYSIKGRKVAKRGVKVVWLGTAIFTGISVYGNLAYGLMSTTGTLPGWIVATKPYVLAATLPVLALYLAELISDNRQHAVEVAEKTAKKVARGSGKTVILPEVTSNLATVNADRIAVKRLKMAELTDLLAQNPEASNSELASQLNISRATVRNYRQELNGNGSNSNGN